MSKKRNNEFKKSSGRICCVRFLSVLLSVAMIVGMITVSEPQKVEAAEENLITNGGFDTVSDWVDQEGVAVPAQSEVDDVTVTDVVKHGTFENMTTTEKEYWSWGTAGTVVEGEGVAGSKAMAQVGTGAMYFCMAGSEKFQAGVTYTVTFQGKVDASTTSWVCYLDGLGDATFTPSGDKWSIISGRGNTAYQTYTFSFTPGTGGSGQVGFQVISASGTFYIDNLTITYETTKTTTVNTDVVQHGTFENITSTEEQYWSWGTAGTVVEDEGVDGSKAMAQVGTGAMYFCMAESEKFQAGVTYTVTFQGKVDASTTSWVCYLDGLGDATFTPSGSKWSVISGKGNTAYQTYTFSFTPGESGSGQVGFQVTSSTGTFYIDNLTITYSTTGTAKTYTQGIGTCLDAEADNVLSIKSYTEVKQTISMTSGVDYAYSFQVKSVDAGSDLTFGVQAGDTKQAVNVTSDWTEVTGTINLDADATTFGFYRSGTGEVLIDDVALYDTTPKEKGEMATIDLAWMHYSEEYMTTFTGTFPNNTGSKCTTSITILVNGVEKTVSFNHSGNTLSSWMGANILSTTELNEITIPANTTWNDSNGDGWFYIENDYTFYTQKLEGHWLTWVSEYDYPYGADVQYEDMGSGKAYMFTNTTASVNDGMRGVFVVEGESDLTLGGDISTNDDLDYSTTKTLGDYHVKRTVGTELYDYTVALYKRGNAHDELEADETADVLDVRDLVAVKKATKTGAASFGYARKKAADANVDGKVNSTDVSFLREALVNDWNLMDTTKGETLFDQGTMPIIGYGGPGVDTASDGVTSDTDRMTDKSYSLISEMGFNALTVHTVYADNPTLFKNWAYPALTLADQYGLKLYLSDPKVASQTVSNTVTPELLAQRIGQYSEFDSFAGLYVADEPLYDELSSIVGSFIDTNSIPLAYIKSPMETMLQYNNMHSWLNLYPSSSQTLSYSISKSLSETSESDYNKYLDRTNEYGAEAILYDAYLRTNGYATGSYELDYEHFYENMDWVRTKSISYGKPFQAFVQVGTDFWEENDAVTVQSNLTTKQEMFLEANAALAMGAKGLNYFNVMQGDSFATNEDGTVDLYRNGVINVNGEPNYGEGGSKGDGGTYNYVDAVTKINFYVAGIDEVLMNAENKGVITTDSTVKGYIDGAAITSYGAVTGVSGDDAFVGCFDYYGKDAYLVVNKSVSTSHTITLDFGGVTQNYATTDMTLTTVTGSGASLALTIPAGESVLVMLDYEADEREATDDFDTAFRFVVASDIHMETANDTQAKRFSDMFDSAYAYAETQDYSSVDAVVLLGDIVDKGIASEYDELAKVLASANINNGTEVLALMGNHEWWTEKTTGADLYLEGIADIDVIQEKGLNWSKNIGGYQFIGMSPLVDDTYGDNIDWMASEVDAAATSNKPVFTFQHHAISDTVYGSENGGASPKNNETTELDAAYANHNQVINFSGHSHAPINTPTAINQTTYTQFTTGTLKYLTCDGSATVGTHPANNTNAAQFTIVEVSSDNKVRMLPYDEYADQFFAPLGNEQTDRIEYTVDVNDSSNWLYTSARKDNDAAPYFASNANITISDITFKAAQVTFDQARDDTGVYAYDIECISPEETVTSSYRIYSEWYFSPMPSTLSYPVADLAANTTYTVSITPIDFFGNEGTAITKQFTTAEKTADDMLTLTLHSVDGDNTWWFNVNNMDLVASQYYKLPVTIDGTQGHVIIGKNSDIGRMVIWSNFFPLCGDAAIPASSFTVTAGTVMQEVSSSNWKTPIAGGDSVEIGATLTIELVNGAWTVK